MPAVSHSGRLLRRELKRAGSAPIASRSTSAFPPAGSPTFYERRSITADTALRLGRCFGNNAQFWLDLQSQYDIAIVERERGAEIARRVPPADAA